MIYREKSEATDSSVVLKKSFQKHFTGFISEDAGIL